jgi:hypothetical protein
MRDARPAQLAGLALGAFWTLQGVKSVAALRSMSLK